MIYRLTSNRRASQTVRDDMGNLKCEDVCYGH
jgi:hypothetical protein